MTVLRTPEARFDGLADFPFAPHFAEVPGPEGALRLHYVEEGPADGPVVLLMHGQPSWSYLYRRMIPPLAAAGRRVIAPDLVGFGKSDKPANRDDYTYEAHVAWMSAFVRGLDLRGITLFCQDWGGLIGLRLVAAMPERFAAVVAANTALPVGTGMSEAFAGWLAFSQSVPVLPVGQVLQNGSTRTLGEAEVAAYDAPFPDETYKAGARQFPTLVPITPGHASVAENKTAWEALKRFDRPFVTAFSDRDPITAGGDRAFQALIPGAQHRAHVTIGGGGHFLQEDAPEDLVEVILRVDTEPRA